MSRLSNKIKFLLGVILASILIISSIMTALSMLKDEAVNNYLTISKLNARSFSKELNQDLTNIEQVINNISTTLDILQSNINISKKLKDSIRSYPQIRSINILQNDKILYSSNQYNIGLTIELNDFFPQPIFEENVLRISVPWIGRDFISGNSVYTNEDVINEDESSFIPISKKIITDKGEYSVIVNLNSEYFINRFITNTNSSEIIFELTRLDGILLLSTQKPKQIGRKVNDLKFIEETIEKNEISSIEKIDGVKYILTYILTDNYPISLAVKLDYNKSLLSWNKKQYNFFIITTMIVILSILLALISFYFYNKKREQEIYSHKLQLQEKEKFRLLFQDSHFLSAIISHDGKILDLNNLSLIFLGKNIKEVQGVYFWDLECWRKKEKTDIKKSIRFFKQNRLETEIIALDKDKNEKIIEFTLSSVQVENEQVLLVVGVDVTLKKKRENQLKQAYTVFENTRDGIIITDKDTRLTDVNSAFERITGYSKDEILGKKINILKSNKHADDFYKKMWIELETNGYWEGEIINLTKNNEEYTEWLTINTIYKNNNEVVNYIGVFSDITEQKLKEKLLREKDITLFQQSKLAAMGEMIGNIAHQWRQPLSAISSAATGMILQKDLGISTHNEEIKALAAINNSTQYLSQTIEDFRNFLRLDKEVKLFNINDAIERSISLTNIRKKSDEINIILDIDKHLEVKGIKNEFIQVIINLLNNARDALKDLKTKKFIFIDVYKQDDYIFITVKDSGGGISNDIINRIFEPYFTTKHQSQGTGIGLYMSVEIIKNHMKGNLSVENEKFFYNNCEYVGAFFSIRLPFESQ
jgi:PAS domain S-box-containing protein